MEQTRPAHCMSTYRKRLVLFYYYIIFIFIFILFFFFFGGGGLLFSFLNEPFQIFSVGDQGAREKLVVAGNW